MAFPFLRNPLNAILGTIRGVTDIAGSLRQPLGSTIGAIGRALAKLGTNVEAAAIRAKVEREAELARESAQAAGTAAVRPLTDADIPEATTKLRRKYSYTLRLTSLNPLTGNQDVRHITISSDRLRPDEELRMNAMDSFAEGYGITDKNLISIEITGVKRAGESGTL